MTHTCISHVYIHVYITRVYHTCIKRHVTRAHLTQGSACSTLTSWNTPWPSRVPTRRFVSQQADSLG